MTSFDFKFNGNESRNDSSQDDDEPVSKGVKYCENLQSKRFKLYPVFVKPFLI